MTREGGRERGRGKKREGERERDQQHCWSKLTSKPRSDPFAPTPEQSCGAESCTGIAGGADDSNECVYQRGSGATTTQVMSRSAFPVCLMVRCDVRDQRALLAPLRAANKLRAGGPFLPSERRLPPGTACALTLSDAFPWSAENGTKSVWVLQRKCEGRWFQHSIANEW